MPCKKFCKTIGAVLGPGENQCLLHVTPLQQLNEELKTKVRQLEESKAALEEKNEDLEQFHDVVVGRELKMIELEQELSRLKDQGKRL